MNAQASPFEEARVCQLLSLPQENFYAVPMNLDLSAAITLPSIALRLAPWHKRWLVYQVREGALSPSTVAYAATFVRRSSAVKALRAAQARTKILSYRTLPQMVRLPYDNR